MKKKKLHDRWVMMCTTTQSINLNLLQVFSKLQEWFCEGIWSVWPCLSLTAVCGWGSVSAWSVVKWRLLVVRALCPSTYPCFPTWLHPPPPHSPPHAYTPPTPHPLTRSKLPVGWSFICHYLSDAVHLWAWLPLCTMGGCGRSSNPSGSLLSATAAVRSSLAASVSVWQPPWRKG